MYICELSSPYSKKTLTMKSMANKDGRKFGRKHFGELKSICIRNVMEIVKFVKTWQNAVIHQFHQNILPPMFFTVQYVLHDLMTIMLK